MEDNNKIAVVYIRGDAGKKQAIQYHGVGGISLQDGALAILWHGSPFVVVALYNRDEWMIAELVEQLPKPE
jgi:hypothetical protein